MKNKSVVYNVISWAVALIGIVLISVVVGQCGIMLTDLITYDIMQTLQ